MNVHQVKACIKTKDPYQIAKAMTLPPLPPYQRSSGKDRSYSERLTIEGVDWSPVLNAFLETRDHALAVSITIVIYFLNRTFEKSSHILIIKTTRVITLQLMKHNHAITLP